MLKTVLAVVVTFFGLFLLMKMLMAEANTSQVADYKNYYDWAKFGGLVFIAVGVAYILYSGEDTTSEPLLEEQEK